MRATEYYDITPPVPFVDVRVHKDNKLYLDPSAIRNFTNPRSQRAHELLVGFFSEVLRLRRSDLPADHSSGLEMLKHLHEPNQTRLGMSAHDIRGNAFGDELANDLWETLESNEASRNAVLTRLEHLPLFIYGVGADRVSDLTTRVIFEVLVDFTHEMIERFPSIGSNTRVEEVNIYNQDSLSWEARPTELPFINPYQFLLVPKEWTYWRTLMARDPFYNRFSTETVKYERAHVDDRGKIHGPSKKSIKNEFPNKVNLNIKQAVKYKREEGRNLVQEYQGFVDQEFDPISDDEITRRTP
jgi:hypothetical protein